MFESVSTLNIHMGRLDESIAILRETVFPILLAQPGLLSLALIPRPELSQLSLVSIWKSLAHAQAAEANPHYRKAVQKLDPLIVEKPINTNTREWRPNFKTLVYSPN